jgi:hypothetical protein
MTQDSFVKPLRTTVKSKEEKTIEFKDTNVERIVNQ